MENKRGFLRPRSSQAKRRKRRRSKGFMRAAAEYLLSDSYMYAPLVDSPLSDRNSKTNVDLSAPQEGNHGEYVAAVTTQPEYQHLSLVSTGESYHLSVPTKRVCEKLTTSMPSYASSWRE